MTAWDRYWFGPVAAVRPYVLERAVLFLLALDSWVQFVPHGGRYGAGGFNVAHFLWLDAIQPLPSPALHVGLVLIVGGLAWVIACTGGNCSLRVLLLVLYTYGWAMSRLDAYQHHYLLSLLLGAFVFFPALEAANVLDAGARRISAWAYVVVAANLAIVYTFAAVTKTEAVWASGAVLQQVTGGSRWFQSVWSWVLHESGVRGDVLWEVLARAVAVMQILIASAYVVAVRADASRARWVRLLAWAALVAAVGFHGSLLSFPIEIRWFSYYMIAVAGAFFLPERALDTIVRLATFPLRMVAASAARWSATRFQAVAVAASASCIVALVGSQLDLPGGTAAGLICAGALAALGLVAALGTNPEPAAVAAAAGALVLAVAVRVLPVRFEYYLYVVADLQRRGDAAQVLAAYQKAEPYAPRGQSRERQIEALRRQLETHRDE